jgi:erythromycin esterase-like protein
MSRDGAPRHGTRGHAVHGPVCHARNVPSVASLDALHQAVADFTVTDPGLVIEPAALAAARRSLDSAGLLLLGEAHGVRETPLLIRALMLTFGLTTLALEWPESLTPVIRAYLAEGTLADHPRLWGGDGRITAGHLAVLAERADARALELILFDGVTGPDWTWSQRDEAMARRILAASPPGTRTLVVAGNAHTPTGPINLGVPMGARLAAQRSGIREIRINYGTGSFWNFKPHQFTRHNGPHGHTRLHQHNDKLVLDLPLATEAVVPQRGSPNCGR